MKEEKEEIPLKTILQNFLNHVKGLEVAREDSLKGEGADQYEKEFQVISVCPVRDLHHPRLFAGAKIIQR